MDKFSMSRRDALRMMGLGATGLAAASIFSPLSRAGEFMDPLFQGPQRQGPQGQRPQGQGPQGGPRMAYQEKEVYSGPDVIIRQIDENTWEGNGHLMANETIYIIEGKEKAILLDAGS